MQGKNNKPYIDFPRVSFDLGQNSFDLGQNIGSRRWFGELALLISALALVIGAGFFRAGPSLPQNVEASAAPEIMTAEASIPFSNDLPASLPFLAASPAGVTDIYWSLNDRMTPAESLPAKERNLVLKRGDTLMGALIRAGADRKDAYKAIEALSGHVNLRKIQVGQPIRLAFNAAGRIDDEPRLSTLVLQTAFDQKVISTRSENGDFSAHGEGIPALPILMHGKGEITDSLFLSAARAGLPPQIIIELIRIFSFDVDFQREIRKGDSFEVLFERRISAENGAVEDGNILYASLTLRGREFHLFRHRPGDDSRADYFDPDGQSARKALMKTPIDGARLTSSFGMRKHPVLGYNRMHQGSDFRAPTGTPIMAAGDGVIERSSRYGAYGNYIRIRHNGTYKTAYAHLSRYARGVKKGARVKQGQIIGYSGSTGRVTAAHLHYEVLVNGKRVNPLTLKLPTGRKLNDEVLADFILSRAAIEADLRALRQSGNIIARTLAP